MNAIALVLIARLANIIQCKSIVQHPAPATDREAADRAAELQRSLAGTIDDAGYRPVQVTCMNAHPDRGRMNRRRLAAACAAALTVPVCAFAAPDRADVAMVLAIDVSGSVDDHRFKLQREGVAAALESKEVTAAILGGVNQTIEIAVVEWAEEQLLLMPWVVVRGQDDLASLAARLRNGGRSWLHTKTDPGGGIAAAEHLFAGEPLVGLRRIIDVSGDGTQDIGEVATADARDAAVSHGVTINGLSIGSGEQPRTEEWYRANVVGGLGAFLIVADSDDPFAEAFPRKLTLEISGRLPNSQLAAASQ